MRESMGNPARVLGLIAGAGDMPREIIRAAQEEGYEIACVALSGMAHPDYAEVCPKTLYVHLGELDKTMLFFQEHGVQELFFAGKVEKTKLFSSGLKLDGTAQQLFSGLMTRNDDAILGGVAELLASKGLKVLDSTRFLKSILPPKGVLTGEKLPDGVRQEIDFGYKMAKSIADLDIGQTVVVKDRIVLAVEAIEGTDEAILRGGSLGRVDTVVVKVAKPSQDLRFDMPTVGPVTIQHCIEAKVRALAFDSGATILLNRDEVLKMARENSILIVSL